MSLRQMCLLKYVVWGRYIILPLPPHPTSHLLNKQTKTKNRIRHNKIFATENKTTVTTTTTKLKEGMIEKKSKNKQKDFLFSLKTNETSKQAITLKYSLLKKKEEEQEQEEEEEEEEEEEYERSLPSMRFELHSAC